MNEIEQTGDASNSKPEIEAETVSVFELHKNSAIIECKQSSSHVCVCLFANGSELKTDSNKKVTIKAHTHTE